MFRGILRTTALVASVLTGCGGPSITTPPSATATTSPIPLADPLPATEVLATTPAEVGGALPTAELSENADGHCSISGMDLGLSSRGFTQDAYVSYNADGTFALPQYTISFDASSGPRPAQTPIEFCLPTAQDLYQVHVEDSNLVAIGKSLPNYSTGTGSSDGTCTNDAQHDQGIGAGQFYSSDLWSAAYICGPPGTYTIITLHHHSSGDAGDGAQQRTMIVITS